jgi:predicted nucleic acid-binding protein
MAFVDTNIILRWLLGDHPLSAKAARLVIAAKPGELVITSVVAAEIVYVLGGLKKDRTQLAATFGALSQAMAFSFEDEASMEAIDILVRTGLDFADCYLIARAVKAHAPLHTFDAHMSQEYARLKGTTD